MDSTFVILLPNDSKSYVAHFPTSGDNYFDAQDGVDLVVRNNVFGPNHFGYASSAGNVSYADWSNNVVGDIAGNPTGPELAKP